MPDFAPSSLELVLIVPVFNEEQTIIPVLTEWRTELARHTRSLLIIVINDGSTDNTEAQLTTLDWPELRVHTQKNRGHGQSCLEGYRQAATLGSQFVFQIDSDGQCDPSGFAEVWNRRDEAPSIYGRRTTRDDGWSRKFITRVLRLTLKWAYHTRLNDTNVPFRLYPASLAAETANRIPASFELANIAMALLLEPRGYIEVPIHFRDRAGGHASVRWMGFVQKARRLFTDLKALNHVRGV